MRAPLVLLLVAVVALVAAVAMWPSAGGDPIVPRAAGSDPADTVVPRDPQDTAPRTSIATADQPAIDPHIGVVVVTCRDEGATPLPGCRVKVGEADLRLSGADGRVAVDVEPGRQWIEVTPPDASRHSVRQRVTARGGRQVAVDVELLPARSPDMWCRVVAAESQEPLADATLRPLPGGTQELAVDEHGTVEVVMVSGVDYVQVDAPGRGPRRIVPAAGHTSEAAALTVPLEGAAELQITVVDAKGQPVPEPDVMVSAMAWSLMWPARTAAHGGPEMWSVRLDTVGRGALDELPAHVDLYVAVTPPPGTAAPASFRWQLEPGANTREVALPALGGLQGRVLDSGGRPVAGANVAAIQSSGDDAIDLLPDGDFGEAMRTGADGSFALPELQPGTWLLGLQRTEGWTAACKRVEVPAGAMVKVDLRADPALAIAGRLLGPGNDPISAFEVHALQNGILVATAITDQDGAFRLEPLAAGDYDIFTELYQSELAMAEPVRATAGRSDVVIRVLPVLGVARGRAVAAPGRADDLVLRGWRRGGDEFCGGRCDLDGRFEQPRLRAGVWDFVVVDGHGGVGVLHGVEIMAGRSTPELEIELRPGATLRPSHAGASAFRIVRGDDVVAAGELDGGLPAEVVVPPGTWTVVFLRRGFELLRREVTIGAGEQLLVAGP